MKQVLIIIDGLSDDPINALNGQTPLELAFAPNMHYISTNGFIGRIDTFFDGYPIESLVCNMALLGYDPKIYYPNGRASFEAMAKGIPLRTNDLVLRCNIINVKNNKLNDFTAGMIPDSEARKVISRLKLPFSNWELYPGQSYRNILVLRNVNVKPIDIKCFEPHMHIGHDINEILPKSLKKDKDTELLVEQLKLFIHSSYEQIKNIEILDDDNKGNMLWVWSPSSTPLWPTFYSQKKMNAALVAGLDFFHGIAMAAGIHYDIIPNATGYIDTDYQKKGEYAINYLSKYDFVIVHVNAADEAAHARDWNEKINAIENIDRLIIGPLLYELEKKYKNNFRIAVCGDHKTRCSDGKHIGDPVPLAVYGKGIKPLNTKRFNEINCNSQPAISSLDFLKKTFIRN